MSIDDFRRAAATRDIELAMTAVADDIVVRSPLTDRITFNGKEDVRRLFATAFDRLENIDYHTVIGDGPHRALLGRATANGRPFEETLLLTFDEHDKITGITLSIRPLTGITAVMAALGPTLARRNGRSRLTAAVLRLMIAPLVAATRLGDRLGMRLALPRRPPAPRSPA